MPDPGQVYYLPPELREGPDKGDRPHLVVSLCAPGAETSTFAYGSTKATDALRRARAGGSARDRAPGNGTVAADLLLSVATAYICLGRSAAAAREISRDPGATHCLVVTEPGYSRTALQQTTFPLLNAMEFDAAPGDVLVQNTSGWLGRFALRCYSVLIAVALITTVHARDCIARYTRTIVTEATMRDVEASLVLHFGLSPDGCMSSAHASVLGRR